jgi:hypothetical protein
LQAFEIADETPALVVAVASSHSHNQFTGLIQIQ